MPEPKNKSLDGVPRFDGIVDAGLYTMVSVPLVSLTPPGPELTMALRLAGCVPPAIILLAAMPPDFFLSITLPSAEHTDTFLLGICHRRLLLELLPVPWSSEGGDVVLRSIEGRPMHLSLLSRSFRLKLHLENPLPLVRSYSEPSDSSFLSLARPRSGDDL